MTDAVSEGGGADRRAYSRRGAEVDEDLALFEEVELLVQLDELEGGASAVALLFGELIPLVDSAFAVLRGVVSGRAGGRSMRANTFFWIAMVVAYKAPTGRRAGYQSRRRLIRSAFPPKRFTVPAKAGWASVWRGASGVWRVARVAQLALDSVLHMVVGPRVEWSSSWPSARSQPAPWPVFPAYLPLLCSPRV
jgi:hypothetical protein